MLIGSHGRTVGISIMGAIAASTHKLLAGKQAMKAVPVVRFRKELGFLGEYGATGQYRPSHDRRAVALRRLLRRFRRGKVP